MKVKKKYEKMKENVRNLNEKQENMGLNSVNSKTKNNKVVDSLRGLRF